MNAAAHPIEDDDDRAGDPPEPERPTFHRVTEEEFLQLPESTDRVELIDGEIHVAPSATAEHQLILQELGYQLSTWIRRLDKPRPAMRYAPCDVRFGPDRILQPDLFVILGGLPRHASMPIRTWFRSSFTTVILMSLPIVIDCNGLRLSTSICASLSSRCHRGKVIDIPRL